jgi:glucose-6-phosphate 1-dehydrogenase
MDPSTTLVIFGASGDLTRRKLIPALYELHRKGRLPDRFLVLGAARSPSDDEDFRQQARLGLMEFAPQTFEPAAWNAFAGRLHYLDGDFTAPQGVDALDQRITELSTEDGRGASSDRSRGESRRNLLFYLATPPQVSPDWSRLGRPAW